MNTLKLLAGGFVLSLFLNACNPERVQYTGQLKQEMADKKIKRITNSDLVETIDKMGAKITAAVQKELTTELQKTNDPAEQAKLCQLQGLPRTKAIAERYALDIRLMGAADVQNKTLNAKEREVLDAYLYNAEQKLPQVSNIQKTSETSFIYNAAVPADNPICAVCFSGQKTPLAVWRLAFEKREVIRRMSATKKK